MLAELTQIDAGWPLAASLAAIVAAQGLLAGRRRALLNEALHELRRPLQALTLAASRPPSLAAGADGEADLTRQAALALERLDREVNGGPEPDLRGPVEVVDSLAAAARRWRGRARRDGIGLELRQGGTDAVVSADRGALARALDNLIVNAIEHGGGRVVVGAELAPPLVRVTVADSGGRAVAASRRQPVRGALTGLSGRGRRGHGLRVVRRVAAAHGGEFRLCRHDGRTEAVLELPLAAPEDPR